MVCAGRSLNAIISCFISYMLIILKIRYFQVGRMYLNVLYFLERLLHT